MYFIFFLEKEAVLSWVGPEVPIGLQRLVKCQQRHRQSWAYQHRHNIVDQDGTLVTRPQRSTSCFMGSNCNLRRDRQAHYKTKQSGNVSRSSRIRLSRLGGSPVVRAPAQVPSLPGLGTKIPHTVQCCQKNLKNKNKKTEQTMESSILVSASFLVTVKESLNRAIIAAKDAQRYWKCCSRINFILGAESQPPKALTHQPNTGSTESETWSFTSECWGLPWWSSG